MRCSEGTCSALQVLATASANAIEPLRSLTGAETLKLHNYIIHYDWKQEVHFKRYHSVQFPSQTGLPNTFLAHGHVLINTITYL